MNLYKEIKFFSEFKKKRHVYHLISAHVESKQFDRNDLIELLFKKFKIKCVVQYYPLYMYPLFKKMGFRKNNCPNTDIFYKNMISFPFHIWMSNKEFLQMIKSIKKAVNILRKN